jgi:hypothetical protein
MASRYSDDESVYKFPGEYCLNISKQIEYKSSAYISKIFFYIKLDAFVFAVYVFIYFVMLNRCLGCHFGHFHHQNIETKTKASNLI